MGLHLRAEGAALSAALRVTSHRVARARCGVSRGGRPDVARPALPAAAAGCSVPAVALFLSFNPWVAVISAPSAEWQVPGRESRAAPTVNDRPTEGSFEADPPHRLPCPGRPRTPALPTNHRRLALTRGSEGPPTVAAPRAVRLASGWPRVSPLSVRGSEMASWACERPTRRGGPAPRRSLPPGQVLGSAWPERPHTLPRQVQCRCRTSPPSCTARSRLRQVVPGRAACGVLLFRPCQPPPSSS